MIFEDQQIKCDLKLLSNYVINLICLLLITESLINLTFLYYLPCFHTIVKGYVLNLICIT